MLVAGGRPGSCGNALTSRLVGCFEVDGSNKVGQGLPHYLALPAIGPLFPTVDGCRRLLINYMLYITNIYLHGCESRAGGGGVAFFPDEYQNETQ